jgi:transcriptional regulator with PAS, ATPase and Fis domain
MPQEVIAKILLRVSRRNTIQHQDWRHRQHEKASVAAKTTKCCVAQGQIRSLRQQTGENMVDNVVNFKGNESLPSVSGEGITRSNVVSAGTAGIAPGIKGIVFLNHSNQPLMSIGAGADPEVARLVANPEWMADALLKRIVPVLVKKKKLVAHVTRIDEGNLVLLSEGPTETFMRLLLNCDFAYDIIDHVLTDPYGAMVVVNAEEKLAFISPVHEKFFNLQPGEGIGKNVREVIENSRLGRVLKTGMAEVGQVLSSNGSDRIVSRQPIRRNGRIVGAIGRMMFKGHQQVEELARRLNALEQKIAIYKMESSETTRGEKYLDAIIGQSLAIQSLRQQIRKVAPLDVPVLILGESGTGKELVAGALHMLSARHSGRLVTVNTAALPAALVESELFGYEAGSFTGADKKGRPGKFELADKGTIFLDEIGDMPMEVQSKLLRVLQDQVVERIGGDKAKRVDFRLISATNRDLELFVEQDKFRLDFFYRISPVQIILPTLAERIEDIPLLLHHFIREFAEKYGRPLPTIDDDVPAYLMARSWPGNVRQLQHEVEHAFVFADNTRLTVADFPKEHSSKSARAAGAQLRAAGASAPDVNTRKGAVDQLERDLIISAMAKFKGNKKKVAESLGISRSYLYKKLAG